MGFNRRKAPDRTICVAVDLSAAFDTVCHNNLLSKINRSQFPPAKARWLSCYLRGNQRLGKSTPASRKSPNCHHHCCCCRPTPPCLFGGVLPYFEVTGHPVAFSSLGFKCSDCIWNCSYIVYPAHMKMPFRDNCLRYYYL